MPVTLNLKSNKIPLCILQVGEFFRIDNQIFLKTSTEFEYYDENNKMIIKVFDFTNNRIMELDGNSEIVPLNTKIDLVENMI